MELTNLFKDVIAKEKLGEEILFTPTYPTGIDMIDYGNGRTNAEGSAKLGLDGGKMLTVVGAAGTGKTTLSIQMAANIVEPFKDGQIIHIDFERASTKERILQLSNWTDEEMEKKYILLNRGVFSETLYKLVKSVSKIKLEKFEELKIKTGEKDRNGKEIFVLPPTVFIVDSIATMTPQNIIEEEELSGGMTASAIAKTNNAIIKRIVGITEEANIIIIAINHITQKIEIGPVKTAAPLNYLKQDESLPGGSSCMYLANTLIKLRASSKLDPEKELGVKGFIIVAEFIKSRTNVAGTKFNLVFNQAEGYMNLMSNFRYLLKDAKRIGGGGRGYFFPELPDVKFTQKNVVEKLETDTKLKSVFDQLVKEEMVSYLSNVKPTVEIELVEEVKKDVWRGSDGLLYDYDEASEQITPHLDETESEAKTKA